MKDKEVEELANKLCAYFKEPIGEPCQYRTVAEALYKLGYRKHDCADCTYKRVALARNDD